MHSFSKSIHIRRSPRLAIALAASLFGTAAAHAQSDSAAPKTITLPPVKLSGFVQTDLRTYINDDGNQYLNNFTVRRVRLDVAGNITKQVAFKFTPDIAGSRVQLLDAYGEFTYSPAFKFRVGKFKVPSTLERAQSAPATIFVESGTTLTVAPNYDVGVQLSGSLAGGIVSYAGGVFDGVVDGGSVDADVDDAKDLAGTLQLSPFAQQKGSPFSQLVVGVGGSHGKRHSTTANTQLTSYRSAGGATIYNYRTGAIAEGTAKRVSAYAANYTGPVSVFGEWINSSHDVQITPTGGPAVTGIAKVAAYQVYGTVVLTGEAASFRGVTPKRSIDQKGLGAVELVVRYDQLRFGDAATNTVFTDLTRSVTQSESWTGGFNWYLSKALRFELNYQVTTFTGGATTGNRLAERAIFSRFQTVF